MGLFTMQALKAGCRTYAFEPNRSTFRILSCNVSANAFKGAILVNKGLGETEGELTLFVRENLTGTSSFDPDWEKWVAQVDNISEERVRVTTLDAELTQAESIDWLLVDVEGFERQLLRGARRTLQRTQRVLIEVSQGTREEVLSLLFSRGFVEVERGSPRRTVQYFLLERLRAEARSGDATKQSGS